MDKAQSSRTDLARGGKQAGFGAVRRSFAPWCDPDAVPLVRIEGVAKHFGGVTAIEDLSLDIHEREFFCLLGPSGCGKTTLMRMLAGFETPDRGIIRIAGEDVSTVPPHRRPVNMMFQSYALFPHMSVAQNIGYGLRQEATATAEIELRVAAMLRLVQLDGFGARRPEQLSGGQRQRVALARALVKRPRLLLLDEPLAALDRKLREETQFELMDLQAELGTTFLVVTHDQEEAMTMADRIAVMDRGRIAQVATPAEIYEQPASRFVAGFVGDVNLFEGTVAAGEDGRWSVASTAGLGAFDVVTEASLTAGQEVALAVRPEKLSIHRERPTEAGPNILEGEVWDIGYLGDWTTYRVKLATGAVIRVSRANARRRVADPIGWEERVHVAFPPDAAIVLTR